MNKDLAMPSFLKDSFNAQSYSQFTKLLQRNQLSALNHQLRCSINQRSFRDHSTILKDSKRSSLLNQKCVEQRIVENEREFGSLQLFKDFYDHHPEAFYQDVQFDRKQKTIRAFSNTEPAVVTNKHFKHLQTPTYNELAQQILAP